MTAATLLNTPEGAGRIRLLEVIGNGIVGGMESCVTRLIERLPRERFIITALCPFESMFTDGLRAQGVEVVIAPMPEDPLWSSIQMTCALIKAGAIDVLHAHLTNAHMLAGLAGSLTGKAVLATIHGRQASVTDLEIHRSTGTHISVVSKHSYFNALGLGVNPAQLSCIPNGVDTDVFCPGRSSAAGLRQQFGIPDESPLVGFVGRLAGEKGAEVFVRAGLLLRSWLPSAHMVLIGEGPFEAELRSLIERFQLGERVHLAGLRRDMPAVYHELDMLVSSSHSEAMPLVLMEAMASGLPVIATRVGGVPDLVEQGQTGWLVTPGDFEGIAAMLAQVLSCPADLERMSSRARARALERFSLADSVAQTERLLTQLASPYTDGRGVRPMPGTPNRKLANGAARAGTPSDAQSAGAA